MSVSDAEFLNTLRGRSGAQLTVLCEIEFAYQTASGGIATGTIYLAEGIYRTREGEAPASTNYMDAIAKAPDFGRGIDLARLGGRGTLYAGALTLENTDGSTDFLLDRIVDGREIRVFVGRGGDRPWPRADFRLVSSALIDSVMSNGPDLQISLRDKNYLLDDSIIGSTISTGPNAGKPKPIALGRVRNMDLSPYLLDTAALTYAINDFAIDSSVLLTGTVVRDAGLSLRDSSTISPLFTFDSGSMTANTATDTLTYASPHNLAADDVIIFNFGGGSLFAGLSGSVQYWVLAAGLTANDFRLSLTRGGAAVDITGAVLTATAKVVRQRFYVDFAAATIQLSSSPQGRITLDMTMADAGGELSPAATPHAAFKYILEHYSGLAASEYDVASIDSMIASELSELALYGRIISDRVNILTLLDEIATTSRSWYSWDSSGVLFVGRLDLARLDSATPIDSIVAAEVLGDVSAENLPLQAGKIVVDARRNGVKQTDGLAGAVSADDRSRWSQEFQFRTGTTDPAGLDYLGNWWDYHLSAIDSKPMPLVLDSGEQTACDAITALFAPWTRVYRLTVGLEKYALKPGDCVQFTYPRFGLNAGKNTRVMSVRTRLTDRVCELVLVRKETPDYLAAG